MALAVLAEPGGSPRGAWKAPPVKSDLYLSLSRSPRKAVAARIPAGATVVDVGCGDMIKTFDYVHRARPDARIVGVEKFEDGTIYGRFELPAIVRDSGRFDRVACDIEREPLPFETDSVDAVYCSHVLEHLDPKIVGGVLTEMYRILKPGGIAYIEVPGPRALVMGRDSWAAKKTVNFPLNHWNDPTHVRPPFEVEELGGLLSSSGFSVERTGFHREFGLWGMPAYGALFAAGLLPLPVETRSLLLGTGWWNLVGWPLYAIASKPSASADRR
jgi:SAM-dependent methyltransferase